MKEASLTNLFLRNQLHWFCIFVVITSGLIFNHITKQANNRVTDQQAAVIPTQTPPPLTENLPKTRPEYHPKSIFGKKGEPKVHPIIFQTANKYQIDPALVGAIIMAESEYNPRALSRRGARGLMQLMPETAKELGVKDIYNPRQNIDGGVRYFKQLLNRFDGDVILALAAYNAGSRKVMLYRGVPPFKATKRYIRKVFRYHQVYKNHLVEACSAEGRNTT